MTKADLIREVVESVRTLWRIRAATTILRSRTTLPALGGMQLQYENIPTHGVMAGFKQGETITAALDQLSKYESTRLRNDIFLMMISLWEMFLSAQLKARGKNGEGTLGKLKSTAEHVYQLSGDETILAAEVIERRNILMHHNSHANDRYITVAQQAEPISNGQVTIPTRGSVVTQTEKYLAYTADVIVRHANLFP